MFFFDERLFKDEIPSEVINIVIPLANEMITFPFDDDKSPNICDRPTLLISPPSSAEKNPAEDLPCGAKMQDFQSPFSVRENAPVTSPGYHAILV